MKSRMLSVLIAAALAAGVAQVSAKTPAPDTPKQQAARAEIDRLVRRIEELSRQLGEDGDVRVIVHRGHHGDRPMNFEMHGEHDGKRDVVIRRRGPGDAPVALPGKDGERKVRIERYGDGHGKWKERAPGAMDFRQGPGLGIVMASNPAAAGVRIAAVTPDGPAMKAGIRTGDILLQVNGKAIYGNGDAAVESARNLIGKLKQGQVVKLRYARRGKTHDASVTADDIRPVMAFSRSSNAPRARMPHGEHFRHGDIEHLLPPGVEMDIQRIGPMRKCAKGEKDCGLPVIYEAFRWQGLNLASIDSGLGRYFGTERGVLVLSSGEDLKGLQSGDVIQRVGGVAVESPRDVMRALRQKETGAQLKFDLMRDRRALPVTVTVPKSRPLPFITPPPPPAPPAPMAPRTPHPPHAAPPPPPPAPPAPPRDGAYYVPAAPAAVEHVQVQEIEIDGSQEELVLAPAE